MKGKSKMSKLKSFFEKLLCLLGFHTWIHIGAGENIFTKRYCDKCRRQEQWCEGRYYRIENISYSEMRSNY